MPLKKIVIIGPESTGKSTLCEGLAAHFHTGWVPEFAREYLLAHGMNYTYEDLLTIARGQIALEDAKAAELIAGRAATEASIAGRAGAGRPVEGAAAAGSSILAAGPSILFVDTDLYVMKVWSEFVYGRCDPWVLGQIASRKYDGYLLCRTDLPWVKDELREYPDPVTRDRLYEIYRDLLANQPTPWVEIGGMADERLACAIEAVGELTV